MAVANTVTQIVLPGLDKVVQDQTVAALAANPTVAAILSNLAATGSKAALEAEIVKANAAVAQLPSVNPLPTFATYSCRDNRPYWNIYNSKLQPIDAGSQHTDTELWAPWAGWNYTNSHINSSTVTTSWSQATPFQQADGHWMMRLMAGNRTSTAVNPDAMQSYMPYFGVIIGKRGVRQNFSLFNSNSTLRIMERGIAEGFYENIDLNNSVYSTWTGQGTTYGSACYNDRTRTLVVVQARDGANNYRMHIWKNEGTDRSLNSDNYYPGTLDRFLREAKLGLLDVGQGAGVCNYAFYDFQWQANSSQNYDESRYRMRVVAGDNGIIGMARMVPSNACNYATFNPATTQLTTSFNTIGLTTSYGIEQGQRYGMRHNITWDNNWVAAYSCYYYYGSGMNVYFIDTRDPRNYFTGQQGNSQQGCQLVPYQEDKFLFNNSTHNVDNAYGLRLFIIEPEAALQGRITNGTISNGASLVMEANPQWGRFDTDYTSTNYPGLQTLAHWTRRV
jgi:hypothetical protein